MLPNRFHPKVREERVKAVAGFLNATAIALILGALAGPLLNPAQQIGAPARIGLALVGFVSLVAAQLVLGYIVVGKKR